MATQGKGPQPDTVGYHEGINHNRYLKRLKRRQFLNAKNAREAGIPVPPHAPPQFFTPGTVFTEVDKGDGTFELIITEGSLRNET